MKIAFDIDGVLADTTRIMKEKVAAKFDLPLDSLVSGADYTNIYQFDDQILHNEVNDYARQLFLTDPEVYAEADEIPGAWFGSAMMKPIAYITRRPHDHGIREATEDWLRRLYFYKAPVYFVPRGTCKSIIAKQIGADVLIEDSPAEIASCRENGLRTVIFKYPYNLSQIRDDSEVVTDWKELFVWYTENRYDNNERTAS